MKAKSAIQKGKALEDYIADQIRAKGMDHKACRSAGSGSGNREKADISTCVQILGKNIGIEAKNHKNASMKAWWQQTCKLKQLGREPILVYKLRGESLDEAKAVVYLDTLLDLIKYQSEDHEEREGDELQRKRKIEYAIENIKQALKGIKKNI